MRRSIKKAAASLKGQPIHVLVNNASVAAPKGQIADKTKDGFEARTRLMACMLLLLRRPGCGLDYARGCLQSLLPGLTCSLD